MKKRLIKEFNKLYFKNGGTRAALNENYSVNDLNKFSLECVGYDKETLNILSDLLQIINGGIKKPYSLISMDILWNISEYNIKWKNNSKSFPEEVFELCRHLNLLTNNAYFVGGCVRDTLKDIKPKDFDFVCGVNYNTMKNYFLNNGYVVKEKGEQFLVLILSKNGYQFEIACFRKDGTYVDGRRPESVNIGNIYEDSERRDFTINAGYVNTTTFKLKDPTGKFVDDLNENILRFIGKPKDRIKDDALRVFRFYRFVSKGYKPDKKSLKACRENFNYAVSITAPERIRAEIEKMININV